MTDLEINNLVNICYGGDVSVYQITYGDIDDEYDCLVTLIRVGNTEECSFRFDDFPEAHNLHNLVDEITEIDCNGDFDYLDIELSDLIKLSRHKQINKIL